MMVLNVPLVYDGFKRALGLLEIRNKIYGIKIR